MNSGPPSSHKSYPMGGQGPEKWPKPWQAILLFDFYLLAILVLAGRLATCLHEIVGHGLTAVMFGGRVNGVHVSLFGGGWTDYQFDREIGVTARFLVSFGGIFVNFLFTNSCKMTHITTFKTFTFFSGTLQQIIVPSVTAK